MTEQSFVTSFDPGKQDQWQRRLNEILPLFAEAHHLLIEEGWDEHAANFFVMELAGKIVDWSLNHAD